MMAYAYMCCTQNRGVVFPGKISGTDMVTYKQTNIIYYFIIPITIHAPSNTSSTTIIVIIIIVIVIVIVIIVTVVRFSLSLLRFECQMAESFLERIDPNNNGSMTMAYSLFIAIWSVQLLQRWNRREAELRFLWGHELDLDQQQGVRTQFQGRLKVNPITGRETQVERGFLRGIAKKTASWLMVAFLGFCTASAALLAEVVGTWKPIW